MGFPAETIFPSSCLQPTAGPSANSAAPTLTLPRLNTAQPAPLSTRTTPARPRLTWTRSPSTGLCFCAHLPLVSSQQFSQSDSFKRLSSTQNPLMAPILIGVKPTTLTRIHVAPSEGPLAVSLTSTSTAFPLLSPLKPHSPSCCSSRTQTFLQPQGLCTGCSPDTMHDSQIVQQIPKWPLSSSDLCSHLTFSLGLPQPLYTQ